MATTVAPTMPAPRGPGATLRWPRGFWRSRLVEPMPDDRVAGWLWPLAVAVIAGVLRFWRLGTPSTHVFDEVYYPVNAWQMIHYGVAYVPGTGTGTGPQFLAHPPAGKWVIALGELVFGNTPLGWRVMVALAGTLTVLMVARIGRRLFRSTLLGTVAAVLLAFDGLSFVMSRTGLLDNLVTFWALAAFGLLLLDRDRTRLRLGRRIERNGTRGVGPGMGVRPYRIAAGLALGLGSASKWSGLYFLAVFAVMSLVWDVGARRTIGVRRPVLAALVRDSVPAFLSTVLLAAGVYLISWAGWFLSGDKGWDRNWAQGAGPSHYSWIPASLRSLWHYQVQMYDFNINLRTFHPYMSNPWSWSIMGRPTYFYYEASTQGHAGCQAAHCSLAITSLGTPAFWWAATAALFVVAAVWIGRRDWRAGAVLAGVLAGWGPWFQYQDRTIFTFYAVAFAPWMALAVAMVAGLVLGGPQASVRRRVVGASTVGTYLLLVIANFVWLYPVLAAEVIPYSQWAARMWFPSWI